MKIILATGIYPPDVGGPATYVKALAQELTTLGHEVMVVTYQRQEATDKRANDPWPVITVSKSSGPLLRWRRYANTLTAHGADADVVYAFSLVSSGIPLLLARLKRAKRVLRLGGDFFWERYVARGGQQGLQAWYAQPSGLTRLTMSGVGWLLRSFDQLVFSTPWLLSIYQSHYRSLPPQAVVLNALPKASAQLHSAHDPLRLLYLGRFTAVKNLSALLQATVQLPRVTVTLVGEGPLLPHLRTTVQRLGLSERVSFLPPVTAADRNALFAMHDALALPSLSEVSPNAALEARAAGLPVLLTNQSGLSVDMKQGMLECSLVTPAEIAAGVETLQRQYGDYAQQSAEPTLERGWSSVALEHVALWENLVATTE